MLILKLSSANHTEAPLRINAAFCHVTLPYAVRTSVRENCLRFRRDLPISLYTFVIYLLAIYFLSNGYKKLLDVVPSANYLCILPNASIIELPSIAYRPLRTNLIQLNNKFRIVTTKEVLVITRRLSERAFYTRYTSITNTQQVDWLIDCIDEEKNDKNLHGVCEI